VETGHHPAALALPDLAADAEDARQQAHLGADLLHARGATEAVRAVAQRRRGTLGVRNRLQTTLP
jgi:hypothetical protein